MASSSPADVLLPPGAAQAAASGNSSTSPYMNNAERIYEYTIDYEDEAKLHQGIRDVAREIVGGWRALRDEDMGITVISGGITNLLYRVQVADHIALPPSVERRDAIVRIYGRNTEVIIQREHENRLFAQLSALGFAPPYLGRFSNGRVEGYLDARPLTPEELAQTSPVDITALIAQELARMHAMPVTMPAAGAAAGDGDGGAEGGEKTAVLWTKMGEWATLAKGISFDDNPGRQRQLEAIGLERLGAEMAWLRKALEGEDYGTTRAKDFVKELVFSHQDLLCGNILYNPDWSPPRVQFIDFEYGGYNPRGFDWGNHFCEYAGFDPDYEKSYPAKPQQLHFLRQYVQALMQQQQQQQGQGQSPPSSSSSSSSSSVVEKMMGTEDLDLFLEELYVVANRYACAAHLFWGYWAIIQAKYSPIDFDFLLYASQRLDGYRAFKAKFF